MTIVQQLTHHAGYGISQESLTVDATHTTRPLQVTAAASPEGILDPVLCPSSSISDPSAPLAAAPLPIGRLPFGLCCGFAQD